MVPSTTASTRAETGMRLTAAQAPKRNSAYVIGRLRAESRRWSMPPRAAERSRATPIRNEAARAATQAAASRARLTRNSRRAGCPESKGTLGRGGAARPEHAREDRVHVDEVALEPE